MLKIENNNVRFVKARRLTNKQLARAASYSSEKGREAYILSCLGMSRARLNLPLKNNVAAAMGTDKLKQKAKNHVLALLNGLKNNGNNVNHKPLGAGNWIGIEIECLGTPIANYVLESECNCSKFRGSISPNPHCRDCSGTGIYRSISGDLHEQIRQELKLAKIYRTSVRYDGSLRPDSGQVGVEITLLLNTDKGFGPLVALCELLKTKFKVKVNTSCGLHVHFDYSKKGLGEAQLAAKRVAKFIPILALLQPESRRCNSYCKPRVSKLRGDRYYAVNMTSYQKHGTIEIRMHSGSVDAAKIQNWVNLLRTIFSTPVIGRVNSIQDMFDKLSLKDELVKYVDERYYKFNELVASPEVQATFDGLVQTSGTEIITYPINAVGQNYIISAANDNATITMSNFQIMASQNAIGANNSLTVSDSTSIIESSGSTITSTSADSYSEGISTDNSEIPF